MKRKKKDDCPCGASMEGWRAGKRRRRWLWNVWNALDGCDIEWLVGNPFCDKIPLRDLRNIRFAIFAFLTFGQAWDGESGVGHGL